MIRTFIFLAFLREYIFGACATNSIHKDDGTCGLYLAPSIENSNELAVYTAVSRHSKEHIGESQFVLSMIDANKNEYSPWHDFKWNSEILPSDLLDKYKNSNDVIITGIGTSISCAEDFEANVAVLLDDVIRNIPNMNCADDSSRNDMSCYGNFKFVSTRYLEAGEQLSLDCTDRIVFDLFGNSTQERKTLPVDWLVQNGICYDELIVASSSVKDAGRGAFLKRNIAGGNVIAVSPVLHFDKSQIDIVEQGPNRSDNQFVRAHEIEYSSNVIGKQIIINYCLGDNNSNVLLLPHAPGVNFINHHTQPNAYIRWSNRLGDSTQIREKIPIMELFDTKLNTLAIEYVALRDIAQGEEIFIDYGSRWSSVWKTYRLTGVAETEKVGVRHEIQVPDNFYPSNWMRYKRDNSEIDFIANPLKPGYLAPVRWYKSGNIVSPWLFRMGLKKQLREVLNDYCNRIGITDTLAHVTREGNSLEAGNEEYLTLDGNSWYIQRPAKAWRSNLHWLSPGDGISHESYLQALGMAGFDDVLESLGEYLGLEGLVVFHVTFIAVSYSTKGYIHHDMGKTGGKAYNIIIPLHLANETEPELDLTDDNENLGKYHYEEDVAILLGDYAKHGTAAVDYRWNNDMRLAATIYVADFNDDNIDTILSHFTQAYPPADKELITSWVGAHWRRDDKSKKLPQPTADHVLRRTTPSLVTT